MTAGAGFATNPHRNGRPEETGRSFQDLVSALEFSVLLLKFADPAGIGGRHPRGVTVIDVGPAHPKERTDSTPYPS